MHHARTPGPDLIDEDTNFRVYRYPHRGPRPATKTQ